METVYKYFIYVPGHDKLWHVALGLGTVRCGQCPLMLLQGFASVMSIT